MRQPLRRLVIGGVLGVVLGTLIAGAILVAARHHFRQVQVPDQVVPLVEFPPAPPPPRWAPPPRYRVARAGDSFQVLDEMDRVVILRGLEVGAEDLEPPFRPVPFGDLGPFEQWDAWGFNGIRLLVPWEALEPEPRRFNRDHLEYLRWFLDQAWRFRMAVVLVPYQDRVSRCLGGVGAPAWTHRPGVVPEEMLAADCRAVDPGGIRQAARRWRWWTDFTEARWTPDDLSLQDHLIDTWQKLAEVFYNHPALLGFETLGGIPCPSGWQRWLGPAEQPCGTVLADFQRRFAQAIRNVDRDALIFLNLPDGESPTDPEGPSLDRPDLEGIALAAVAPDRPDLRRPDSSPWRRSECRLDAFLEATRELAEERLQGPRVLVGYGTSPGRPGAIQGLFHQAVDIEDAGASAFVGTPLLGRPSGSSVRPRCLAAALVRPFPVRVAGTDVRWSFDRSYDEGGDRDRHHGGEEVRNTDTFTLAFRQGSSTADTLVFIPRFSVFRDDDSTEAPEFTIDLSDGQWRWAPGDPDLLVWTTRPDVAEHRLVLRPWGGRRAPGTGVDPDCLP
ncbi:MAG TPA: hypothetical protein PLQ97_09290 [Myxococcota bacterium]|nr:hypothetical protein [Myxococcota bacterium]HQK50972.1 hypothetical protein [Myxococcota bacterium]